MKLKLADVSYKKTAMVVGLIIAMIIILAVVTYFFFSEDDTSYAELPSTNEILAQQPVAEPNPTPVMDTANNINTDTAPQNPQDSAVDSNPADLQPVAVSTSTAQEFQPSATNTIASLKYTIKPLDMEIAICDNVRNGKWNIPKDCEDSTILAIHNLIETNAELIALEVSGIVDNSPYAGPSAELKQEGLASFRAREAIGLITRNFSNVAVFEGLSKEQANKRGFEVKAYYLQN